MKPWFKSGIALAAGLFVILTLVGTPLLIAAVVAALAGFALRATAIVRGIGLPGYRD